jgi:hypothetical protein
MTPCRLYTHPSSNLAFHAVYAGGLRGLCAKWRIRRQCEARARELEAVLREMDQRLHKDIGFELMGARRGEADGTSGHALIQAVSIAFADEPSENA